MEFVVLSTPRCHCEERSDVAISSTAVSKNIAAINIVHLKIFNVKLPLPLTKCTLGDSHGPKGPRNDMTGSASYISTNCNLNIPIPCDRMTKKEGSVWNG